MPKLKKKAFHGNRYTTGTLKYRTVNKENNNAPESAEKNMATKWGIVSAGKISHDFTACLTAHDPSEHKVVAVAARSLDSANEFASLHNIEKAYGSYEALASDPNVEVVYVGNINTGHLQVCKMMLEAGKHVICEKPLGMNLKEVQLLNKLAKERQLFLMEAIWSRCLPAYRKLKEEITAGSIGEVLHVNVTFGAPIASVERVNAKKLGGGVILDIGIYTVQLITLVFSGVTPTKISAVGHLNQDGVDESVAASYTFTNGRLATSLISSRATLPNEAIIVGTKGTLRLGAPFWAPRDLYTPSGHQQFQMPEVKTKVNYGNSEGLYYESAEVRSCLQAGLLESPLVTHEDSELIHGIMTELRRQIGVQYPQDTQV